jgi:hypothetical protein
MDEEADYIKSVIAARCGDAVADAVIPVAELEAVIVLIDEPQERIDGLDLVFGRRLPASGAAVGALNGAEAASSLRRLKRAGGHLHSAMAICSPTVPRPVFSE